MHIKASLKLQTKAHLALTDRQPSGYSVEGTEYGVATFASVGTRGNSRAVALSQEQANPVLRTLSPKYLNGPLPRS